VDIAWVGFSTCQPRLVKKAGPVHRSLGRSPGIDLDAVILLNFLVASTVSLELVAYLLVQLLLILVLRHYCLKSLEGLAFVHTDILLIVIHGLQEPSESRTLRLVHRWLISTNAMAQLVFSRWKVIEVLACCFLSRRVHHLDVRVRGFRRRETSPGIDSHWPLPELNLWGFTWVHERFGVVGFVLLGIQDIVDRLELIVLSNSLLGAVLL